LKAIGLVYSAAHVFFWCLLAAIVAMALFSIPRISEARAVAERERLREISAENRFFCEKWGLRASTHEHLICTMDLNEIRSRAEKRLTDNDQF
jgi:hypothetical protein